MKKRLLSGTPPKSYKEEMLNWMRYNCFAPISLRTSAKKSKTQKSSWRRIAKSKRKTRARRWLIKMVTRLISWKT